jgi:hypothetical protein
MESYQTDREFINQMMESKLRNAATRYDHCVERTDYMALFNARWACGKGNCGIVKRQALEDATDVYHTQIMWNVHYDREFRLVLEMWSGILNKWYEDDLQWAVDEMVEGQVEERMLERCGFGDRRF